MSMAKEIETLVSVTSTARIARIHRAVYHHAWDSLAEWAGALDELATLDDRDIETLIVSSRPPRRAIGKAA
jgi:hypothetical protein